MKLFERLPDSVVYKKKTYRLNLSFDRVLQFFDIQEQPFSDEEKLDLALFLFVKTRHKNDPYLLQSVLNLIFDKKHQADQKKSFDFVQDAKYIYSSFMQAYNIDLFDQQNKLHWWKFVALLNGLPADTRLMEIIRIRLQPLPEPNKHNAELIKSMIAQKAAVRLEMTEEERQKSVQESLGRMVRSLEAWAKNGKS